MEQIAISSKKVSLGKKLAALVAVGAIVVLSGCSNVNAAATIGSEVITTDQVQKSVSSILALRKTVDTSSLTLLQGADIARNVLNLHIAELLIKQAAAEKQIVATDADVAKYKAELIAQIGGATNLNGGLIQNSIAAEDFNLYARYMVLLSKVTTALNTKSDTTIAKSFLANFFSKVKVTLNARYGKWNAATGQVDAIDATSGAVAAPSPTPSK